MIEQIENSNLSEIEYQTLMLSWFLQRKHFQKNIIIYCIMK